MEEKKLSVIPGGRASVIISAGFTILAIVYIPLCWNDDRFSSIFLLVVGVPVCAIMTLYYIWTRCWDYVLFSDVGIAYKHKKYAWDALCVTAFADSKPLTKADYLFIAFGERYYTEADVKAKEYDKDMIYLAVPKYRIEYILSKCAKKKIEMLPKLESPWYGGRPLGRPLNKLFQRIKDHNASIDSLLEENGTSGDGGIC